MNIHLWVPWAVLMVNRGMEVRFFREAVTVKGNTSLKSEYLPKEPCKELRNPGRFV